MLTKKNKRTKERMEILNNCDRATILGVTKALLDIVADTEQYFKEKNDFAFFLKLKNPKLVVERENKIRANLCVLHSMFND